MEKPYPHLFVSITVLETVIATSLFAAKRNTLFQDYPLNLDWAFFCSVASGGFYIIAGVFLVFYILEQKELGFDSSDPLLTFSR